MFSDINSRPNVELHAFSPSPIPCVNAHTTWIPPHPQRGTPYHRYVLLLVPQAHPTERIKVSVVPDDKRLGFNYREFAAQYGLDASKGGGVHMFREVWDETVSKIYKDVLSASYSISLVCLGSFCAQKQRSPITAGRRNPIHTPNSRQRRSMLLHSVFPSWCSRTRVNLYICLISLVNAVI